MFCFIRTALVSGHTNVPNFLLPFLQVDTVGEAMVSAVYSGYGSIIYLPGINRVATTLVSRILRHPIFFSCPSFAVFGYINLN